MATADQLPAEVFPPGEFIQEEIEARGWTIRELAERMGGNVDENHCCLELLIYAPMKNMILDDETAAQIGAAFGTSAKLWINLDRSWRSAQPTTHPSGWLLGVERKETK